MPIYSYKSEDGQVLERHFGMGKAPQSVTEDGVTYKRWVVGDWQGRRDCDPWPLYSDALGVAHDQVKEASAALHKAGIPTHFTDDGRCVLENREHRRRVSEHFGYYDKSGGYSDPQRGGRN